MQYQVQHCTVTEQHYKIKNNIFRWKQQQKQKQKTNKEKKLISVKIFAYSFTFVKAIVVFYCHLRV